MPLFSIASPSIGVGRRETSGVAYLPIALTSIRTQSAVYGVVDGVNTQLCVTLTHRVAR